ncbi:hypothetical protein Lser_V15G27102 [Lactuca serriola]
MADILDFNDTINGEITIWSNPTDPKPKCGCRHPTKKRTSWTVPNPTQRFFNGLFSMTLGIKCSYFDWIDPKLEGDYAHYKTTLYEMGKGPNGNIVVLKGWRQN